MSIPIHHLSLSVFRLLISFSSLLFFTSCSGSGDSDGLGDSSVASAAYAYDNWPNQTTTDSTSANIVSKVLISDLDQDGVLENIFISELFNSTNPKNSILRITQGREITEIVNFKSDRVHLFKDSIPYAVDLDKDGSRELLFVSFDRDQIIAFEFKSKDLKKIYIRWILDLPNPLADNFERKFSLVSYEEKEVIKIGDYGFFEKNKRKPEIIDLKKD